MIKIMTSAMLLASVVSCGDKKKPAVTATVKAPTPVATPIKTEPKKTLPEQETSAQLDQIKENLRNLDTATDAALRSKQNKALDNVSIAERKEKNGNEKKTIRVLTVSQDGMNMIIDSGRFFYSTKIASTSIFSRDTVLSQSKAKKVIADRNLIKLKDKSFDIYPAEFKLLSDLVRGEGDVIVELAKTK